MTGLGCALALVASRGYPAEAPGVALAARNVDVYLGPTISVHLEQIAARLVPRPGHDVVDLDATDSFAIRVVSGCTRLSADQLARLFNDRILAYRPRSLDHVVFKPHAGAMTITGGVRLWHRVPPFWMPFSATARVHVDNDGLIALRITDEHLAGLPVGGALDLVHIRLAGLLGLDRPGVSIDDDTVRIDTRRVMPGPRIVSRPRTARLDADGLQLCFGPPPTEERSAPWPPDDDPLPQIRIRAPALRALGLRIAPARITVHPPAGRPLAFRLVNSRAQIAAGQLRLDTRGRLIIVPGPIESSSAGG